MLQNQCLTLSVDANALAKANISTALGLGRMGFRFESKGPGNHTFGPLKDLRVKDYVVQLVPGGVVVFIDPDSLKKGYGTDIHIDGKEFVFSQSNRVMPEVAEKTEQKKAEDKARRAAAKASRGMKPGADKESVVRAAKEASLASDEIKASKKKAVDTREGLNSAGAVSIKSNSGVGSENKKPAKKPETTAKKAVKKAI